MENKTVFNLFAVSQPGIEEITLSELGSVGIEGKVVPGGVEFKGGLKELYLANLSLRTANRILLRVASFKVKTFPDLVRKVSRYPWAIYFPYSQNVKVRATCKKSKLYHSEAVAERVLRGIHSRLRYKLGEAKFEDEGTSIIVRLENDICTISVNSSGKPLHKRGYRVMETEAPLRENLASAIILASGWDKKTPLVDPFCGSGTIPIEAAMISANIPPGIRRDFAFMDWKNFDKKLFESIKKELESGIISQTSVYGFDISDEAIDASMENAAYFNLKINFEKSSFPFQGLPEIAYVVTNPPYGKRIITDTVGVYRDFGKWIKKAFPAVKAAFLAPDKSFAKATGLRCKEVLNFSNGGIKVRLYSS